MAIKYKTERQIENLSKKIIKAFLEQKSVFLVGKTDEGKTYFVKNFLIFYLKKSGIKTKYFKNINELKINKKVELAVIDEVEILDDKEFLEEEHPEESPYYTKKYLKLVKKWHQKLSKIEIPCVYLITRNNQKDINYLKKNIKKAKWNGSSLVVLEYKN